MVRMRAQNDKERELPVVAKVVDEKVIVFDPKIQTSPEYHRGRKRPFRDLNKRVNRNTYFAFDRVFDETASNLEVFSFTTEAVVTDVLDGYNACGVYKLTAFLIYLLLLLNQCSCVFICISCPMSDVVEC